MKASLKCKTVKQMANATSRIIDAERPVVQNETFSGAE